MEDNESKSFEYTSTWVVAVVCTVIILLSIVAERGLHRLGKFLKHHNQVEMFEALQKLKEELMILGFISLLLTVTQKVISKICIPGHFVSIMLPCKDHDEEGSSETPASAGSRRLLESESAGGGSGHCAAKNMVPMLSVEAVHQLHIFIFVLAVVYVIFCATTMVLGRARIQQWRHWENAITRTNIRKPSASPKHNVHAHHHYEFFKERAVGYWRKYFLFGWMRSFFKQFYGSVTKADYLALRQGFIMEHCPSNPDFNFHKYMMRTLSVDFKKVVGISWYLWLFVILFLLLNIEGWHSYFWLAFLPLALLVVVGAKLEHIITRLAEEVKIEEGVVQEVEPSDAHFWFGKPKLVLYLIHFILFQNSFEIAFFFWILAQFGFRSCIMERLEYIIPRLVIGVIVQVLCSYSTLPLYVLVTQMGSMFKQGMFDDHVQDVLRDWAEGTISKGRSRNKSSSMSALLAATTSWSAVTGETSSQSGKKEAHTVRIQLCESPQAHLPSPSH
ncbi:unnamed protein product [Rhodiola kirilowii]